MSDFLNSIVKEIGDDYATLASNIDESEEFIDSGSYIFNALISGSIYGGFSANKITAIAGESSTGKTFFALAVVRNFLNSDPNAIVLYFDTESAITKSLLQDRDIDTDRVVVIDTVTVETFRQKAYKCVERYMEQDEADRQPMMMVLDSLGMLSTEKETTDISDGKNVRDMTKSQVVKGTFRTLTGMLGKAKVPLIVTNHTYQVIGSYVPTQEMGGGSGLKYAASTIIHLSKSKEKDGKEIVGNIIKAKTHKSRLSKENQQVSIRLYYDHRGLDKYYGLLELAQAAGIWKHTAGRFTVDGKNYYGKQILANPEKFFTEEVMGKLDDFARNTFSYGGVEDA